MHCNSFLVFIFICCVKDAWTQDCPQHWAKHGFSCYLFIKDVPEDFMEAKWDTGYIGLSDIASEGEWVWPSTGSIASFHDWSRSPHQPDNHFSNQDCAMFYKTYNFHWDDNLCTVKAGFICEME